MKRPIAVAFQGGGAKLIGLIAAADAISELSKKEIEISMVSGSSAGSIAAFLLAADANFTHVKRAIRSNANRIDKDFGKMGRSQLLMRATLFSLAGRPVYSSEDFNDIIEDIFDKSGISVIKNIEDFARCPVFINSSDVYLGKTVPVEAGNIRDAIRKSCAIPFIFSSHRSDDQGQFADGGIFDNLPVDILIQRSSPNVPVFAIGFEPENPRSAQTSFEYITSIVFSVISHKVSQSRRIVGDDFIHEIQTKIGTLDFDKIVPIGLDEEYDTIKAGTKAFFNKWMNGLGGSSIGQTVSAAGHRSATRLTEIEKRLISSIEEAFRAVKGVHAYVKMTVDANCIERSEVADEIKIEQLLEIPERKSIPGLIIPLVSGSGSHASTDCWVKFDGPDGEDIKFEAFLINDAVVREGISYRRDSLLMMFKEDNSRMSGRSIYVLKKDRRYGFMSPLEGGRDSLILRASYWNSNEVSIRLNLPDVLGPVKVDWSVGPEQAIPQTQNVSPAVLRAGWIGFEATTKDVVHGGFLKAVFAHNSNQ